MNQPQPGYTQGVEDFHVLVNLRVTHGRSPTGLAAVKQVDAVHRIGFAVEEHAALRINGDCANP